LAHAIHLAVTDVLYKKNSKRVEVPAELSEPDSDSTDEDELSIQKSDGYDIDEDAESSEFTVSCKSDASAEITHVYCGPIVEKVRKVVKIYKKSPLKSENLLKHSKTDAGKEFGLLIDSKFLRNSLYIMVERFSILQASVMKSLINLKVTITIDQSECELITNLVEA
jgi:hypothetical protein